MRQIKVEWPFNAAPPPLFCPACGKRIIGSTEVLAEVCPHLDFVHFEGELEYASESVKALVEALEAKAADADEDVEVLDELLKVESATRFVVSITTSGMACGPISTTVDVGFDMAAELEDDE